MKLIYEEKFLKLRKNAVKTVKHLVVKIAKNPNGAIKFAVYLSAAVPIRCRKVIAATAPFVTKMFVKDKGCVLVENVYQNNLNERF